MAMLRFSWALSFLLPYLLISVIGRARIITSSFDQVKMTFLDKKLTLNRQRIANKGRIYYVSANGRDSNSGLSSTSAFKTIQTAANLTNPGDTVLMMNGLYPGVEIDRSGKANAWITYKAYPKHHPKIQLQKNSWNGVLIHHGASYIEINGLEIIGNNPSITLDYAVSQMKNSLNPLTSGNGISIEGRAEHSTGHPHHIRILYNQVHDCGGGGISAIETDYVTIDGNQVFNNAWYSPYGQSGISLLHNWRFDRHTGYKMSIVNNKIYNNRQYIPWLVTGKITDGNGVIIDDTRNTYNSNSTLGAYPGRTLVENNITYKNGGSGIHTYNSDHVDIIRNTAYLNNQSPEINEGQIFANMSSDVKILRNILYAPDRKYINANNQNKNVTYDHNVYANSTLIKVKGPNDILGDPKFINPSIADFRLQANSLAIGKGFSGKYHRSNRNNQSK
jgi:hypothetical protein